MTPGLHRIPMADYLADPCPQPSLSSSALTTLLMQSPRHAWAAHPKLGGQRGDDSNRADLGTVAHDLLLGGEGKICVIDPEDYAGAKGAVPKGWTNAAIREARDQARENGLTPILKGQELAARAMVKAAKAFLAGSELAGVLDEGEPELTLIAQQDGVWLRARPDWFNPVKRVLLHYKTTEASAEPDRFIRGVMRGMGYGTACAFYAHVHQLIDPQAIDWLNVFLVQEQNPPYACSLIGLDPMKAEIEAENVVRGIAAWSNALRTGQWPAYSGQIHYAAPSAWELAMLEHQP